MNPIQPVSQFRNREDGALTIQGLFLFTSMAILAGIGVDVSNLLSSQAQLQITADDTAHAALYARDTLPAEEAKQAALDLAYSNMPSGHFGDIISDTDIVFGNWDYDTQSFTSNANSRDAVLVTARRVAMRDNPVASYLMQFIGIDEWDIITQSVYTTYRPTCFREGFVGDDVVDIQSNNAFSNGFCIHSNAYVSVNNNNTFEPGTVVSMPNIDEIDMPQSGFEKNDGLDAALRSGKYRLRIINRIDELIAGLENGDPEYTPDYIDSSVPINLNGGGKTLHVTDFTPGKIHVKTCSGSGQLTIDATPALRDVVFVSNCEIKFASGSVLEDVVIATRNTSSRSFKAPSGLQVGRDDGCAPGGGAQLVTKGGMNFAANLAMFGGQLLAEGDVTFAARASGIEGASIVAGGEIDGTSNASMAFCGSGMEDNFEANYFRLAL